MEMGNRFTPYDILLINKDGSHSIFASIKKLQNSTKFDLNCSFARLDSLNQLRGMQAP